MYKKGWKYIFLILIPAFLFSCASKKEYSGYYRALPPKVKVHKNSHYEEIIVIKKEPEVNLDKEEKLYINQESWKLGIYVRKDRDIKRFIYEYAIKNKSYTKKVLERGYLYIPTIKRIFRKYGIPEDLAYLPFIESGFDPYATSVSGAAGLWQFLRGTGKRFGLKINRYVDERRDPYKSTIAAAKYLKYLYNMFGRWDLAIAAYNCGEGCILNKMHWGAKNFWDIKRKLPPQTRDYVPRFLAALIIAKNPSKYGIYVRKRPIYVKKKIVKRNISLQKISYIYDIDYGLLKLYNAHFRRNIAIRGFNVYIPATSKPAVIKVRYTKTYIKHVVKKGETLYRISKMYNVPIEEIRRANNIKGNYIKVGQVLKIPKNKVAYRYEIE